MFKRTRLFVIDAKFSGFSALCQGSLWPRCLECLLLGHRSHLAGRARVEKANEDLTLSSIVLSWMSSTRTSSHVAGRARVGKANEDLTLSSIVLSWVSSRGSQSGKSQCQVLRADDKYPRQVDKNIIKRSLVTCKAHLSFLRSIFCEFVWKYYWHTSICNGCWSSVSYPGSVVFWIRIRIRNPDPDPGA